jgi:hypothetical protein
MTKHYNEPEIADEFSPIWLLSDEDFAEAKEDLKARPKENFATDLIYQIVDSIAPK